MDISTIQNLKTLFTLNRLGMKRESGKTLKRTTQVIRALSSVFIFIMCLILAVSISKLLVHGETDLYEVAKYVAIVTGPLLAYDFLIRASLPMYLTEELPALFTLPIKKKDVILYKLLYNSTGPLVFMWVALFAPIFATISYHNAGLLGVFYAFLIVFILFTINKLVIFLIGYYFSKKKVATILLALLFYVMMTLPAIGYKIPAIANAYGYILVPENGYWMIFTILLVLLAIVARLTYIALRNYKIDSTGNSSIDNSFKFNSFSNSNRWDKLGKLGEQIKIDLLFILRNKKIRQIPLILIFFSLYSLYLISSAKGSDDWVGKVIFPFAYGPLIFYITYIQYESMYMDFYFTKVNYIETMLKSKLIIVSIVMIIQLLPIIGYLIYLDYDITPAISLFSFTPGLLSIFGLCPYIFNSIGIDPDAKTKINKSFSGMIFIVMIGGAILIPILLWLLELLFNDYSYIAAIFINGLILASSSLWIRALAKAMHKRKYKNLDGIRNSLN